MMWQPIESAPEDGTPRLLYWPAIPEKGLSVHYAVREDNGGPFRHPTHWQALDEPPNTGEAKGAEMGK